VRGYEGREKGGRKAEDRKIGKQQKGSREMRVRKGEIPLIVDLTPTDSKIES
jgi:hypothetical protein